MVWALGLGSLTALCAWLLRQPRLYGDGSGLVSFAALGGGESYHHVLVVPLLRLATELLGRGPAGVLLASHLVVASAAGVAVGCLFAALRCLGLSRSRAVFGAALFATTPGAVFFATTFEVHVLHVAAVLATALVALVAPWRRPVLGVGLVGTCLAITYGTHVSTPLIGFGVLGLCQLGARRVGRRFSLPALLFAVGPALLTLLVVGMGLAGLIRTGRFDPLAVDREVEIVSSFYTGHAGALALAVHNIALPLLLLTPLAIAGLLLGRLRGWHLATCLALVVPSWVFFQVWGVNERGAYLLPTAAFLAWPAALAWPTANRGTLARALALVVIAIQLTLALVQWSAWNRGWNYDERVAAIDAALPEGGTVIRLWMDAPEVTIWRPDVAELDVSRQISATMVSGAPPEAIAAAADAIDVILAVEPVAMDVSYTARLDFHEAAGRLRYLSALEEAVRQRFDVVEHRLGLWRFLTVTQPAGSSDR
ncbi:hypothetical protein Pla86_13810 [Planctomycetes bacterium Pla86]|uniref:Glycosyltransferase RgtA/B/C/D-like domain-containing protein n=1 Tax=Engelhardtia mirabilis TaxID=2528011 RepID=A0A518BHB4_9BACT|nr:hypothetical protein Pla133_13820 [Planctomycetes bacterium Pla133]QDV00639.1 hypothetical protein Pla86_13810 [Planctomycetes bacterium Pla86]